MPLCQTCFPSLNPTLFPSAVQCMGAGNWILFSLPGSLTSSFLFTFKAATLAYILTALEKQLPHAERSEVLTKTSPGINNEANVFPQAGCLKELVTYTAHSCRKHRCSHPSHAQQLTSDEGLVTSKELSR